MKKILTGLLALVVATVSGCASYKPTPPAFQAALNDPYRFDSGDLLRITVFEQEGMTNTYPVDQAGYISFPLVGSVPARGKSPNELKGELENRLSRGFLKNPDISIQVQTYRPFFIMGEVATGGQYAYFPGMTVQKAIAVAGGYTPRAEQESVDITRQVGNQVVTGRVLTSDPILPGDTLYVRERWF